MSERTKISCCDSTINWREGCTKVSAGCANYYAEARDKRFTGRLHWGKGAPRRKSKSAVKDALALNRKPWICDACGSASDGLAANQCNCGVQYHHRRIFSLSLGDWLDPEIPVEWLSEMLDTIRQCDQVTWILCTKRPELWRERIRACYFAMPGVNPELWQWLVKWYDGKPPPNIILLASVENQAMADKRIHELLRIPAVCHGLSCEPLLGPVKLFDDNTPDEKDPTWNGPDCKRPHIGWIIAGGESGPNARPCNVEWIRSLVEQGKQAGVATFVKQLGENAVTDEATPDAWPPGTELACQIGKPAKIKLRDKKGGDMNEWPADLRVQEWPTL